jgi:site-specific DNA recombinase
VRLANATRTPTSAKQAAPRRTAAFSSPRDSTSGTPPIDGSCENGIINNALYAGRIVYNRQSFVKDPNTGKRQARLNPKSEWLEQAVPELAIVSAELFEAAQDRRAAHSHSGGSPRRRRPKHLLSGLVACGDCGSAMIVVRDDRVGCSGRLNKGICGNRRTIRLEEIEQRVLVALQRYLLAPDVVAAAIEAYREERNRLAQERAKAARGASRDLGAVERKIARIVHAIAAGDGDQRALCGQLNVLAAERNKLEVRIAEPSPTTCWRFIRQLPSAIGRSSRRSGLRSARIRARQS